MRLSLALLTWKTLSHFWKPLAGVVLAASVSTAILIGAFTLGDSLRDSLRYQALDRLGRIDYALQTSQFFRTQLAEEWRRESDLFSEIVPIIHLTLSLEKAGSEDQNLRANGVQLIACPPAFWGLGRISPRQPLGAREVVLNQTLARVLEAQPGDRLTVYLPELGQIPAESPLGRRANLVRPVSVTVREILPDESLGAFQLIRSQEVPRNAFVDLNWLAELLQVPDKANTLLLAKQHQNLTDREISQQTDRLFLKTEDYGVEITRAPLGYIRVSTERLVFDPLTEQVVADGLQGLTYDRVSVYLAERIEGPAAEAWYATMAALSPEARPPLGPLTDLSGQSITGLLPDECVINDWLATRLRVKPGDSLSVTWFVPETEGGRVERETVTLRVKAITRLDGPARDPDLVPEVRGLTDRKSIADWDPPFPFDARKVTREDEEYWSQYRATPKLFVSPALAEKHWTSRFGKTTSFRIVPAAGLTEKEIQARLTVSLRQLGWQLQPVRQQALAASRGTTPFDVLFLIFNFFVIVSNLILTGLLFALNVERRTEQWGLVLGLGWPSRRLVAWIFMEALVLMIAGSFLGIPLGLVYAQLLIWGLHTIWLPAVGVPFLRLSVSAPALVLGSSLGAACGLVVSLVSARKFLLYPPQALLSGTWRDEIGHRRRLFGLRSVRIIALLALVAAVGLIIFAMGQRDERTQLGSFFGSGALTLLGLWLWTLDRMQVPGLRWRPIRTLWALAMRNLNRQPGRSALTVALMASALFLVIAAGAFYVDVEPDNSSTGRGDGGFALLGEADQPLFDDLNDPQVWKDTAFRPEEKQALSRARIYMLRQRSGEDASCLNLYRTQEPIILGVDEAFIKRNGFRFTAASEDHSGNPWTLLSRPVVRSDEGMITVPAIVDDATAKYAFHRWRGIGEFIEIPSARGQTIRFEFVALLDTSLFQGKILISEQAFREVFPEIAGYRFLLVDIDQTLGQTDRGPTPADLISRALERTFAPEGLRMEACRHRLAAILAVQNTYLSTFQSLGGLGVLLGTVGLAAVMFRGLFERQREIAVLKAIGFTDRRIHGLIVLENLTLLGLGLLIATISAGVAVFPQMINGRGNIPWTALLLLIVVMVAIGVLTGFSAARWIMRQTPASILRRE